MRFWDSSAVVPILLEQPISKRCRDLLRADSSVVVWWLTRSEVVSALCRVRRQGLREALDLGQSERRLDRLAAAWTEIQPSDDVRAGAERLLHVHPLRTADAMQLAAAIAAFDGKPRRRGFVTSDADLAVAAIAEGFDVVVPR